MWLQAGFSVDALRPDRRLIRLAVEKSQIGVQVTP
jgi:hypothetical protein